ERRARPRAVERHRAEAPHHARRAQRRSPPALGEGPSLGRAEGHARVRLAACAFVVLVASCKHPPKDVELTQTYKVQSGLATAHFPKGVKAGQVNDLVAVLRPELGGPLDLDDELYVATHP